MRDPGPEAVSVDSGMIIMVDPCYLFTDKQWSKICARHNEDNVSFEDAILEALKLKKKGQEITHAVVMNTQDGDGRYEVTRAHNGILIKEA